MTDEQLPLWVCDDCGTERRTLPLASDDFNCWPPRAIGPDCPECDCPMRLDHDPAFPET
jgi:hypothetical protein